MSNKRYWLLASWAIFIAGLACSLSPATPPTTTPSPRAKSTAAEYAVPTEEPFHLQPNQVGKYNHYPPSSGLHYGQYLEWGIYDKEVPPEFWVHSLEHGGIVILYNCALLKDCNRAKSALEAIFDAAPPDPEFGNIKILISPNSKITLPVVALAWGWQLDLPDVDSVTLTKFYQKYVNKGPELVP